MIKNILIVGIGGFLGSAGRYSLHLLLLKMQWGSFPLATFLANMLGCLLIGLFFGIYSKAESQIPEFFLLLFATGFCGGFTTFSTFAFENIRLLQQHDYLVAAAYIALSVFFGLIAVLSGLWLAKLL